MLSLSSPSKQVKNQSWTGTNRLHSFHSTKIVLIIICQIVGIGKWCDQNGDRVSKRDKSYYICIIILKRLLVKYYNHSTQSINVHLPLATFPSLYRSFKSWIVVVPSNFTVPTSQFKMQQIMCVSKEPIIWARKKFPLLTRPDKTFRK